MNKNKIIAMFICICILSALLVAFTSCQKEEPEAPVTVLCFTADIEEGKRIASNKVKEVTRLPSELPEGVMALTLDELNASTYYATTDVAIGDFLVEGKVSTERPADDDVSKWITDQNTSSYILAKPSEQDCYADLQALIDENPNRTIYFPDGVYNISRSLVLPMEADKRVSLRLSQYAVIAPQNPSAWEKGTPVLHFGKGESVTDDTIDGVGARIYLTGGTIDGKNVADAVTVDGSGNLLISHIALKNFVNGVNINTNNVDIDSITGVGNGTTESTYINVNGSHNTISNLRMCNSFFGIKLTGGANIMRNLHPLITSWSTSPDTIGFWDNSDGNFYDYCYADQHATSFKLCDKNTSILNGCYAFWWSPNNGKHWGIHADGKFNSVVYGTDIRIYGGNNADKAYIVVDEDGGSGKIIFANIDNIDDWHPADYRKYAVKNP